MPDRDRVHAFVALVEKGRFVEALETFYAEDASMQENLDPPRRGLRALIDHERRVGDAMGDVRTRPVKAIFVEGDMVAINWVFDVTDGKGRSFTLDEIALQRWQGDKVVEERFYYDPAQMRAPTSR